jgi:hypothetical protein
MAAPSEDVAEVFAALGDMEKEFAEVELNACKAEENFQG